MSAMTADHDMGADRHVGTLGRVARVVKLHFANPWPIVIWPWLILGVIFVANLAIWWMIRSVAIAPEDASDAVDGFQYSGSMGFVFVYMAVVAIQAMNQSFAFALGLGSTRRDYYLGSALTFVILATMYAAGIGILGLIENATNGWGLGGRMFTPVYLGPDWGTQLFATFVGLLFFLFVGAGFGAVFVRWRAIGLTTAFAVLTLVVVGGAVLLTLTGTWGAFGEFFVANGWLGSYAWSLVPTAVAAIGGFFLLRGATPRS